MNVPESGMKCVRIFGIRAEEVANLVSQGGAVYVRVPALVWNVQNRADSLVQSGTRY